ncbi:hypothetical protein GCM10022631_20370 [Deinococcus rubellus]|uniref:DUF1795 domain-containing protein n=1 Tax=Deinococcus rubellus TaxID=1889240 RepID=A0ABY5YH30_9DEIO|nr:PsbP-related protein [Deinococcus rubellus]UWX64382.1 hypothetical protein N0D28_01540 [Deinococcus rubellus]
MKRALLSALLPAALLSLFPAAQAATFKSKAYPYTLSVPDDWQSKKVPGVDVALAAPEAGKAVPPSLNVSVIKVLPALKVTLSDVRLLMLKQAKENVKDLNVLGDNDISVSGLPGHLLNYLGSQQVGGQPGVPMHWIQIFTLKNNQAYILTFAAPQATFDQDKQIANKMFNSFKIN